MNKRMRTNLLLAAAVAGLALFVWFGPEPQKTTPAWTLLDIPRESINNVVVIENGETRLALKKTGSGWRVTQPFVYAADKFQVDMLLDDLTQAVSQRYAANEVDQQKSGLDSPILTVQVNDSELAFGGAAPLDDNRYIRRGDHVYLASELLKFRLKERPATDYASKFLLPHDAYVESVTLPSGQVIEKSESGWILKPESQDISSDALQALVSAWQQAQAMQVTANNDDTSNSAVSIKIGAHDEPFIFQIVQQQEKLLLTRTGLGLTFEFPQERAADLLQLTADTSTAPDSDTAQPGAEQE